MCSSSLRAGWAAIRALTSVRQAKEATLAVSIGVQMVAVRSPPASEPANR